jgi:hypothetical protein
LLAEREQELCDSEEKNKALASSLNSFEKKYNVLANDASLMERNIGELNEQVRNSLYVIVLMTYNSFKTHIYPLIYYIIIVYVMYFFVIFYDNHNYLY